MAGVILDARRNLIPRMFQQFPHRLLLIDADLQDELPARLEMAVRCFDEASHHLIPTCPAIQGELRFVIAHARLELRNSLRRNVGRVAQYEIEPLIGGQRREEIAVKEADAWRDPMLGGVATALPRAPRG